MNQKRIVVVVHGDKDGNLYDTNGEKIAPNSFESSNTGSNLETIDLVGCYASEDAET